LTWGGPSAGGTHPPPPKPPPIHENPFFCFFVPALVPRIRAFLSSLQCPFRHLPPQLFANDPLASQTTPSDITPPCSAAIFPLSLRRGGAYSPVLFFCALVFMRAPFIVPLCQPPVAPPPPELQPPVVIFLDPHSAFSLVRLFLLCKIVFLRFLLRVVFISPHLVTPFFNGLFQPAPFPVEFLHRPVNRRFRKDLFSPDSRVFWSIHLSLILSGLLPPLPIPCRL